MCAVGSGGGGRVKEYFDSCEETSPSSVKMFGNMEVYFWVNLEIFNIEIDIVIR